MGCGLRVADCGLWVARCGLRVVGCGLWVVRCGLRVAGYWILDARYQASVIGRFGIKSITGLGMIISFRSRLPIIQRFTNIYLGGNSSAIEDLSFLRDYDRKKRPLKGSKHANNFYRFQVSGVRFQYLTSPFPDTRHPTPENFKFFLFCAFVSYG